MELVSKEMPPDAEATQGLTNSQLIPIKLGSELLLYGGFLYNSKNFYISHQAQNWYHSYELISLPTKHVNSRQSSFYELLELKAS